MSKVASCAEAQPPAHLNHIGNNRDSESIAVSPAASGDEFAGCCDFSDSMWADKNWRSGVDFWLANSEAQAPARESNGSVSGRGKPLRRCFRQRQMPSRHPTNSPSTCGLRKALLWQGVQRRFRIN